MNSAGIEWHRKFICCFKSGDLVPQSTLESHIRAEHFQLLIIFHKKDIFHQDVQKHPEKVGGRGFKATHFCAQLPWTISILMHFWTYPWCRKANSRNHGAEIWKLEKLIALKSLQVQEHQQSVTRLMRLESASVCMRSTTLPTATLRTSVCTKRQWIQLWQQLVKAPDRTLHKAKSHRAQN